MPFAASGRLKPQPCDAVGDVEQKRVPYRIIRKLFAGAGYIRTEV